MNQPVKIELRDIGYKLSQHRISAFTLNNSWGSLPSVKMTLSHNKIYAPNNNSSEYNIPAKFLPYLITKIDYSTYFGSENMRILMNIINMNEDIVRGV